MSRFQADILFNIETGETELWLHKDQKKGWVSGRYILARLIDKKLIDDCADLCELEIIQAQNIEFFRKHFSGKKIFGWRGVKWRGVLGGSVPYLVEKDGKVILNWILVDSSLDVNSCALRRKVSVITMFLRHFNLSS